MLMAGQPLLDSLVYYYWKKLIGDVSLSRNRLKDLIESPFLAFQFNCRDAGGGIVFYPLPKEVLNLSRLRRGLCFAASEIVVSSVGPSRSGVI